MHQVHQQCMVNIAEPARTIRCYIRIGTGHLSQQCIMNLNKMLRVIQYKWCGDFGHIERLSERAGVPVTEPAVIYPLLYILPFPYHIF